MNRFKIYNEWFGASLVDMDERPNGDFCIIRPGILPSLVKPPTIILIGLAKDKVIFAPPKNWISWRPRYPTMRKNTFDKTYIKVNIPPVQKYKLCETCGYNCVVGSVCLHCMEKLKLELEDQLELKQKLRAIFEGYERYLS